MAPDIARCLGAEVHVIEGMGHDFTAHARDIEEIIGAFLRGLSAAG